LFLVAHNGNPNSHEHDGETADDRDDDGDTELPVRFPTLSDGSLMRHHA
jgi:hypothetical protein